MKIAILVSGQPRRYRNGFKDLKKWFLDRYDVDVYLHAWEDKVFHKYDFFNEGKLQKVYNVENNLYQNLVDWYQPKDYLFEPAIKFDAAEAQLVNMNKLQDVWIIGGAQLVTGLLPIIDEFHLSQITGSYDCDTFLPSTLIQENYSLTSSQFQDDVYVDVWSQI